MNLHNMYERKLYLYFFRVSIVLSIFFKCAIYQRAFLCYTYLYANLLIRVHVFVNLYNHYLLMK